MRGERREERGKNKSEIATEDSAYVPLIERLDDVQQAQLLLFPRVGINEVKDLDAKVVDDSTNDTLMELKHTDGRNLLSTKLDQQVIFLAENAVSINPLCRDRQKG